MKELKFRYTNHDWYSLARSFLILIFVVLIVSIIDVILLAIPLDWQAAFGVAVRSIGLVVGAVAGSYVGFKIACKLFDKHGSVVLADDKIIIKLGRKERTFAIKDITEVYGDTFAKYDGLRFRDAKTMGPLYTKHTIVTAKGEFFVLASIEEGWEKSGSTVFGKDNPIPTYSLDIAFDEVKDHVEEIQGRLKEQEEQ